MNDLINQLEETYTEIDYLLNSEGVCIEKKDFERLKNIGEQIALTINGINLVTPKQILA